MGGEGNLLEMNLLTRRRLLLSFAGERNECSSVQGLVRISPFIVNVRSLSNVEHPFSASVCVCVCVCVCACARARHFEFYNLHCVSTETFSIFCEQNFCTFSESSLRIRQIIRVTHKNKQI
jgi:hypothetical protein